MQKLRAPLVRTQGCQRFPLSKPAAGQNIALHAVPAYRASTYQVSAFPTHSASFSSISQCRLTMVECVLSSESEIYTCRNTFCLTLIEPFVVDWAYIKYLSDNISLKDTPAPMQ